MRQAAPPPVPTSQPTEYECSACQNVFPAEQVCEVDGEVLCQDCYALQAAAGSRPPGRRR
jgi:formylmethanofuran dehydrogenase subunit E